MKIKETARGFAITEFKDANGVDCSLQKSSSAMEDRIWLGANKIGMKEFTAGTGWEERNEFDDDHSVEHHYLANTRMHLNQEQVKSLLPYLKKFVKTGEL